MKLYCRRQYISSSTPSPSARSANSKALDVETNEYKSNSSGRILRYFDFDDTFYDMMSRVEECFAVEGRASVVALGQAALLGLVS